MTIISLATRRIVWLQTVGEQGCVVLAKDQKLRYRPLEIAALRAGNTRVFVLMAGNLRGAEIASVFLVALPRICKVLHSKQGRFWPACRNQDA
jgi:hypothetical protein